MATGKGGWYWGGVTFLWDVSAIVFQSNLLINRTFSNDHNGKTAIHLQVTKFRCSQAGCSPKPGRSSRYCVDLHFNIEVRSLLNSFAKKRSFQVRGTDMAKRRVFRTIIAPVAEPSTSLGLHVYTIAKLPWVLAGFMRSEFQHHLTVVRDAVALCRSFSKWVSSFQTIMGTFLQLVICFIGYQSSCERTGNEAIDFH